MAVTPFYKAANNVQPRRRGVAFGDMLAKATLTLSKLIDKLHCNPGQKS
jgi:hypothetical protein